MYKRLEFIISLKDINNVNGEEGLFMVFIFGDLFLYIFFIDSLMG